MPLGLDFTQIFLHLFNVIFLFGGLYYLLYKPVTQFMSKREEYYKQMDKDAREALEKAQASQDDYDKKIIQIEEEIAEKKKKASSDLQRLREKKIRDAEDEAKLILEKAEEDAWTKRNAILDGTKDDIYALIDHATDKLLLEGTTDSFYDAFLDDAERSVEHDS